MRARRETGRRMVKFNDKADLAFPSFFLERIYDDTEDLNYELAKLARRVCTRLVGAAGAPAGGGLRSEGNLFDLPGEAVRLLKAMILDAGVAYLQKLGPRLYELDGPFAGRLEVAGWAQILRAGQPIERHTHRSCLYTGSYYARVPKAIVLDKSEGGDLVLDHPVPAELLGDGVLPIKRRIHIRIEEGLLVLLPSYIPHAVPSFVGGGERIAISYELRAVPEVAVRGEAGR